LDRYYDTYAKAASIAAKWELPHDKLDNGIIIHHIPESTARANAIMGGIRKAAARNGLRTRFTWLDQWTLRATWYKE